MVTTWPIGTKNENWNFLRRFWCRFWWNFRSKIENLLEIMLNCFINNKRNIIIYRNSFNTQMKTSTMFIFRKSKLYYSTHYRNFCDFLKIFEKKILKTLLNPEIFPDCYTFLDIFCNSPWLSIAYYKKNFFYNQFGNKFYLNEITVTRNSLHEKKKIIFKSKFFFLF